jgi:hypothetical protein
MHVAVFMRRAAAKETSGGDELASNKQKRAAS